jgi:glycosyltransferase involved in cell wall biosynthesis
MLEILYLGNKGSEFGGTTNVIEALSSKLAPNCRVYSYSGKKNKGIRLLEMVLAIFRHANTISVALIDTYSTAAFWYAWICALFCRCLGVPFIPILHGGNLPYRLDRSPQMTKAIFGHAFVNVAPSGYLEAAFHDKGYKTSLIPNFIDIENYSFRLRRVLRPRLIWVRSFESTYNPEMSVSVLAELFKDYPDARLCMVGPEKNGSMAKCRELVQELNVGSQVTFTGRLTRSEWTTLAVDYDIFISTTHFDNTPVSVIEAMALGIPIISTNVGGIPYLVEHSIVGLLSSDNDITAMVKNIKQLLESPDLAEKLSCNARKRAEAFDWKVIEKQWLELLLQCSSKSV